MAFTVGSSCVDKDGTIGANTRFNVDSANENGTCSRVYIWAASEMTVTDIASFYDDGGANEYSTRAGYSEGLSITVTTGACREFTSGDGDFTAFSMTSGDYLGIYFSGGTIERSTSSGNGYRYASGGDDRIPANQDTFLLTAGDDIALSGDDTGVGGLSIPIAHYLRQSQ